MPDLDLAVDDLLLQLLDLVEDVLGTSSEVFPSPTPSFSRLKRRPCRRLEVPSWAAFTVSKTAVSTRLTALVRMCGPRWTGRVDADAPLALLLRRVQRAEPAPAGDLEHDLASPWRSG